jgi:hypothetical protein
MKQMDMIPTLIRVDQGVPVGSFDLQGLTGRKRRP